MDTRPLFKKPKMQHRRRRHVAIVRYTFETPHGSLSKGERFRIEGHREIFVFERYVEDGSSKTVECHSLDTGAHRSLYVGKRSIPCHGLRLRPYVLRPTH